MERNIKNVDCALIFMLDEERDFFLQFNEQFIISQEDFGDFKEFTFFDKNGSFREGVICSKGKSMGNTEACALFYKLSRYYKADLYINMGVSGRIKDVNIGDVVVVTRLSTLGEENATDKPWQLLDVPVEYTSYAQKAMTDLQRSFVDFDKQTKPFLSEFKNNLSKCGLDNLCNFQHNKIVNGWCGTVPEVIKGEDGRKNFPETRKLNIIDMEAYYLVLWHSIIKEEEPQSSNANSIILVFKSCSDCGDQNKDKFEECESRKYAMRNICLAVSHYCTKVHEFSKQELSNIVTFFEKQISQFSLDTNSIEHPEGVINSFENLCNYFIESGDENFDKKKSINFAFEQLINNKKSIFLCGRSGTGKSTFMSYLYHLIINSGKKAILLDFSKYSNNTTPKISQLVYLLEKLMCTNKDLYIFLDGVDTNANYYDELLEILDKDNYENISFCISDIIGNADNFTNESIPINRAMVKIEFNGVSLFSPDFENMISQAENYFLLFQKEFDSNIVKNFILKSKITNIDFRLLTMIADNFKTINSRNNSLYSFLNSYISGKYGRKILNQYKESPSIFSVNQPNDLSPELMRLYRNTYANALAVALKIETIFENNDINDKNNFLSSEYMLSDDMNIFLNHRLKINKSKKINEILTTLENKSNDISISVETQLLYSISRVVNNSSPQFERLNKLLEDKIIEAKEKCNSSQIKTDYSWLLKYRTLCIVMNNYFDEPSYLNEFNEKLMTHTVFKKCNLFFHFFYYSKCAFSFNHINDFDLEYLNNELFYNTYYVLKNYLENDFTHEILKNNPIAFMNTITFLHLIKEVVLQEEKYLHLKEEIMVLLNNIEKTICNLFDRNILTSKCAKKTKELLCSTMLEIK